MCGITYYIDTFTYFCLLYRISINFSLITKLTRYRSVGLVLRGLYVIGYMVFLGVDLINWLAHFVNDDTDY